MSSLAIDSFLCAVAAKTVSSPPVSAADIRRPSASLSTRQPTRLPRCVVPSPPVRSMNICDNWAHYAASASGRSMAATRRRTASCTF
jgi:hypothetical protein